MAGLVVDVALVCWFAACCLLCLGQESGFGCVRKQRFRILFVAPSWVVQQGRG